MHPLQNLLSGELARAMLIQVSFVTHTSNYFVFFLLMVLLLFADSKAKTRPGDVSQIIPTT